ncbi:MAG: hypothetical protein COB66_02135 [Coxiella sp. (in: Bacteria)]|nr:MAG: hypothetical protein COB66_02135 [Coxiella sp. (in: g-proteobacteria)]
MIDDTIKELKAAITKNTSLTEAKRKKLLALSDELCTELKSMDEGRQKAGVTIAKKARVAVDKHPEASIAAPHDLIQEFEASHPNATRILQQLFAQFGV